MADFKLRAPPRLRMAAGFQIAGTLGLTDVPVQLAGNAVARAQSTAALLRGVNLGGAAAASAQATAALLRGLRLQGSAVAGATSAASLGWSVAPTITFLAGTGGTFNVAATGPAGYTSGGVYGVDPLNTALPSLITLSEAGVLADGGSAVTSANAIRFTYHEPGALPTLMLHPTVTATLPYHATVYLCEGVVPAGQILVSPNDANLRGSVLSSYADGSAQVMVVAGETAVTNGVTKSIALRPGAPSGTALTASRIDAIVSDIVVNFGGGDQTLSDFTSPLRTWWANSATICCRYVLGCGLGTMRAIIDIHAFKAGVSDRAFVEVVIENGEVDAAAVNPSAPTSQSYTGATVKINGSTIATVTKSGHEAFRAWYCSAEINGGSVTARVNAAEQGGLFGIEVTHDTLSMQQHPLLFKVARSSTVNMATLYSADVYAPFGTGRQRATSMGAPGDHDSIGSLTKWDTHYLQSGDKNARRAVLANALCVLSYNVNYRDQTTGLVPTFTQIGSKSRNADTWPEVQTEPGWEIAHHPAEGLMAFLCRPSPVFVEVAQKIAAWNGSWVANGQFTVYFQSRGRAWAMRSLGHAAFLTPTTVEASVTNWRTSACASLASNVANQLDPFRTASNNPLGVVWGGDPTICVDNAPSAIGFQTSLWEGHWLLSEVHKLANAKLLSGADQTALVTFADWSCQQPLRYVNESVGGEFRYIRYITTMGRQNYDSGNGSLWGSGVYYGPTPDSLPSWDQQHSWFMTDGPPALAGPWIVNGSGVQRSYGDASYQIDSSANSSFNYVTHFWQALCSAVERGVPGADEAWSRVNANVTNLSAWLDGFSSDPRQGAYPRNKA